MAAAAPNSSLKLKLPDDLRSWQSRIENWDEIISDLGTDKKWMKFYLFSAIDQSIHANLIEPYLKKGVDYDTYKQDVFTALQSLLEDEMGYLYNPDLPDPIKAYYVAVKNYPLATDAKILQMIEKHIPGDFYTVLQNTIDRNAVVESEQSTLRKKLLEWVTKAKRDSLNITSPIDHRPARSSEGAIQINLFKELINEIRAINKPTPAESKAKISAIQQQPKDNRQPLCEFHLNYKERSYTCRPFCALFNPAVYILKTADGALRKPRGDRRRTPYQRPDYRQNDRYDNRPQRRDNRYDGRSQRQDGRFDERPQRPDDQPSTSPQNQTDLFDYEKFAKTIFQMYQKN